MKIRNLFFIILIITSSIITVSAQTNSVIGQVSSSNGASFAGGISGDGRIIVFESNGDVATENPRNSDRNREIFVFDYAQRRIFQITDTKTAIDNPALPASNANARVLIDNTRPVISNDGKWIAFASNATSSVSGSPVDGSNPGSFDAGGLTNTVSGSDSLDLSEAEGGETLENIVQPTTPSVVNIRFTDLNLSITAFSVTVEGTDAGGATVSETFSFDDGLNQVGTQIFASVTSVTLDSAEGNGNFDLLNLYYGDGANSLSSDGNMEMWLFTFQNALASVDLSTGAEVATTDLSAGTFTQVTNTPTSRLPVVGTIIQTPIVAADNSDPSISDDGGVTAFVSNRNLVGTGNEAPNDNPEIFTYVRSSNSTAQVTETIRGAVFEPRFNNSPTISGNGSRVMLASNADNPIVGMTGGDNTEINEEIFYTDLSASGSPSGTMKQVTTTAPDTAGVVVNLVNAGRRMSRDGKYIAFDSFADLTNEHSGENQTEFGTFLYDVDSDSFTRLADRSDSDEDAPGGDVARYPVFTDYVGTAPQTVIMETRMNIKADGTVAAEGEDGLNPSVERQSQVYSYPLNTVSGTPTFTRITNLPPPAFLLASIQIFPSNSSKRIALTVPSAEVGTGNPDLTTEVYYLLTPQVTTESAATLNFATGATKIPIVNNPVATPSPTATPTPSPVPTPETPPAVQGSSPGSLAIVRFDTGINHPVVARTAVGSLDRQFNLPIELSGVTMTLNGISVGLKSVSQRQIEFVVPVGLGSNLDVPFPVIINNNGVEITGELILAPTRPDIFPFKTIPSTNRAKIFNKTNRVLTREPFDVRTLKYRGGVKVQSEMRLFLTGVNNIPGTLINLRFGDTLLQGNASNAELVEPGVYMIEFSLSDNLEAVGDQPIVISILVGSEIYLGRLDNDAPRVRIL